MRRDLFAVLSNCVAYTNAPSVRKTRPHGKRDRLRSHRVVTLRRDLCVFGIYLGIMENRTKVKYPYNYLSNTALRFVISFKDLGVVNVSRDVSGSNHVDITVNKANKVLGLLKRTVGTKNKDIFFYALQVTCRADTRICVPSMVSPFN